MTQMYDMFYDAAASNEKTGARSTSKWTGMTGTFGEATASNAGIGWDTSPCRRRGTASRSRRARRGARGPRRFSSRSGAHPSPPPVGTTPGVARGRGGTSRPSATACRTRSDRSPTTCPGARGATPGRRGWPRGTARGSEEVCFVMARVDSPRPRTGGLREAPHKRLGRSPARGDRHAAMPRAKAKAT